MGHHRCLLLALGLAGVVLDVNNVQRCLQIAEMIVVEMPDGIRLFFCASGHRPTQRNTFLHRILQRILTEVVVEVIEVWRQQAVLEISFSMSSWWFPSSLSHLQ